MISWRPGFKWQFLLLSHFVTWGKLFPRWWPCNLAYSSVPHSPWQTHVQSQTPNMTSFRKSLLSGQNNCHTNVKIRAACLCNPSTPTQEKGDRDRKCQKAHGPGSLASNERPSLKHNGMWGLTSEVVLWLLQVCCSLELLTLTLTHTHPLTHKD